VLSIQPSPRLASLTPPPPISPLFPYTTLFRSRYRGFNIEDLAEHDAPSFLETAYLLIYGELPTTEEREEFSRQIRKHTLVHEDRSEEHTSELQSRVDLVCRLLLEKKKR